jgi:hypothetical protein
MLITSTVTPDPRDRRTGSIALVTDGITFAYLYRYGGVGRAKHDLSVRPAGGALAASPRLADILSDIAVQAAQGGAGELEWRVEETADGWSVAAMARRVAA